MTTLKAVNAKNAAYQITNSLETKLAMRKLSDNTKSMIKKLNPVLHAAHDGSSIHFKKQNIMHTL